MDINPGFFDFLFEGMKDIERAASNATCPGTHKNPAVCPFHGIVILVGTTLEKFFGNGHRRVVKMQNVPLLSPFCRKSQEVNRLLPTCLPRGCSKSPPLFLHIHLTHLPKALHHKTYLTYFFVFEQYCEGIDQLRLTE